MKQILIVANLASSFGGNWLQSMKALEKNKDIHLRYLFPEAAAKQYWIKEINRSYFTDWSLSSLKEVWKKINKDAPVDIVHFHFVGGKNGLLCRMAFTGSCRFLWHVHNHDISRGRLAPVKDILKKWMYRDSFKIGVSDSVSDSVKRISLKNVRTVYNAMDFARLDVTGEESCISEKTGVIRCMIMGNHSERKGVDMAAKAVQMLTMGGVKAELYIVADSYFNQQIESFLNQHVGKGWQSFAKIIPTRNDIGTYYKKMDFFLSPSREEGWTWAIEEAAYCGCQVVVSCIPGQDENKVPGFYWVGNPNHKDISTEIADVIKKVYKLPEKDKKESMKKANTYMKTQFSMDKWVENLLAVYDESIKE